MGQRWREYWYSFWTPQSFNSEVTEQLLQSSLEQFSWSWRNTCPAAISSDWWLWKVCSLKAVKSPFVKQCREEMKIGWKYLSWIDNDFDLYWKQEGDTIQDWTKGRTDSQVGLQDGLHNVLLTQYVKFKRFVYEIYILFGFSLDHKISFIYKYWHIWVVKKRSIWRP